MRLFITKTRERFISFLRQGISPHKLSLAVAVGLGIGTIPLLGATSFLCQVVAFSWRLNTLAIQMVNYLVYPLQLLLYIPFLKAGAFVSGETFNYSLEEILQMLSNDTMATISRFLMINLYAIGLWLMLVPFIFWTAYRICLNVFLKLEKII